jgi:ssDNA-binding replication factor A large subunit
MNVSDIVPRQGKIEVELEIVEIGKVREFTKFGNTGRVVNAKAKDSSGEITLTLWNDEIDKVKAGDKIKINNGYCSEFQGEKQLSAGRYGSLEILGK